MRVLFISHVKVPALGNGGAMYSFAVRRLMEGAFPDLSVTEMHFCDSGSRRFPRTSKAAALLRSIPSSHPSKGLYFRSRRFARSVLRELASKPYDLVVLAHAEMLWLQDVIPPGIPLAHLSHNVEHLLYAQFVERYRHFPLVGGLLGHDVRKYARYETQHVRKIRNVITVSTEDQRLFSGLSPEVNAIAVNPAFDYRPGGIRRARREGEPLRLGFIGNLEWWPNRQAVEWMMGEVMPNVRPEVELHLYGKGSEGYRAARVSGHGFVKELSEVWRSVDLVVNPIVSGAGVNVKVAESIYNRMPLLCTSKAVRGLDLVEDDSIAVIDDAAAWAEFLDDEDRVRGLLAATAFPNAGRFGVAAQVERVRAFLGPILGTGAAR